MTGGEHKVWHSWMSIYVMYSYIWMFPRVPRSGQDSLLMLHKIHDLNTIWCCWSPSPYLALRSGSQWRPRHCNSNGGSWKNNSTLKSQESIIWQPPAIPYNISISIWAVDSVDFVDSVSAFEGESNKYTNSRACQGRVWAVSNIQCPRSFQFWSDCSFLCLVHPRVTSVFKTWDVTEKFFLLLKWNEMMRALPWGTSCTSSRPVALLTLHSGHGPCL